MIILRLKKKIFGERGLIKEYNRLAASMKKLKWVVKQEGFNNHTNRKAIKDMNNRMYKIEQVLKK